MSWPSIRGRARRSTRAGIRLPADVRVIEPQGYRTTLALQLHAAAVLTDSGGVQREAAWLGVPCLVLRDRTEWVEAVDAVGGRMVVVGLDRTGPWQSSDALAPDRDESERDAAARAAGLTLRPAGAAEAISAALGRADDAGTVAEPAATEPAGSIERRPAACSRSAWCSSCRDGRVRLADLPDRDDRCSRGPPRHRHRPLAEKARPRDVGCRPATGSSGSRSPRSRGCRSRGCSPSPGRVPAGSRPRPRSSAAAAGSAAAPGPDAAPDAAAASAAGPPASTATARATPTRRASLPRRIYGAFVRRLAIPLTIRAHAALAGVIAPAADLFHGMAYMGIPVALALGKRHRRGGRLRRARHLPRSPEHGPDDVAARWLLARAERGWAHRPPGSITVNDAYADVDGANGSASGDRSS